MRLISSFLIATFLTACATGGTHSQSHESANVEIIENSGPNPWTHLNFANNPDHFTFAIVADLTGGYREGIFPDAVRKLNLLKPEFVISVGDLVEAYGVDAAEIERQWDKFEGMIAPLEAPFFYVAGNHDYGSDIMNAAWERRVGRSYYHFIYRDVMFLILNTEEETAEMPPEVQTLIKEYEHLKPIDPEAALVVGKKLMTMVDFENDMPGRFSETQIAWMQDTLADNPDVKHTLVFMHQPIWQGTSSPHMELLEDALGDRAYSVFAGHVHNYKRFEKHGHRLIRLGTTGGAWSKYPDDPNSFDHVTLITMTDEGPSIANLALDGIIDEHGHPHGGTK